jgi:RNA recognition motif-containing protein
MEGVSKASNHGAEVEKPDGSPMSTTDIAYEPDRETQLEVFVSNIIYGTTEKQLRDLFSRCGRVTSISLPMQSSKRRIRGIAFIRFAAEKSVDMAIETLNGFSVRGRKIDVRKNRGKVPTSVKHALQRHRAKTYHHFGIDEPPCPTTTLFLGNIPFDLSDDDLRVSVAELCGERSTHSRIVRDSHGKSRGFAYVDFADVASIRRALPILNGVLYRDRILRADYAEPYNEKADTPSKTPAAMHSPMARFERDASAPLEMSASLESTRSEADLPTRREEDREVGRAVPSKRFPMRAVEKTEKQVEEKGKFEKWRMRLVEENRVSPALKPPIPLKIESAPIDDVTPLTDWGDTPASATALSRAGYSPATTPWELERFCDDDIIWEQTPELPSMKGVIGKGVDAVDVVKTEAPAAGAPKVKKQQVSHAKETSNFFENVGDFCIVDDASEDGPVEFPPVPAPISIPAPQKTVVGQVHSPIGRSPIHMMTPQTCVPQHRVAMAPPQFVRRAATMPLLSPVVHVTPPTHMMITHAPPPPRIVPIEHYVVATVGTPTTTLAVDRSRAMRVMPRQTAEYGLVFLPM